MVPEPVPSLELCVSVKCEGRANGCRYSTHKERQKKPTADADYTRKRCKHDLRSWTIGCKRTRIMMTFEWDNYGLSALGPAKGHQGMVQTRSRTRIAEYTKRKF